MPKSILVAPAGTQGAATAKQLLLGGHHVHVFLRNPLSNAAKELQSLGAVIHVGDLDSQDALEGAMKDVDGVFFIVPTGNPDPEYGTRIGRNIIKAAQKNDVKHIVLSTVARAGEHTTFPGWADNFLAKYWTDKDELEKMVRSSGIPTWTILRPVAFFQMFCSPAVDFMFPDLPNKHVLRLAFHPDTRLDLIHGPDIGKFAAAAFNSPSKYSGKEVTLAGESLTAAEIAEQLSAITGHKITVELVDSAEASRSVAQGDISMNTQVWWRDIGYQVDIEAVRQYGIPLTPLAQALDKASVGW